jgi:hypothetical protein
MLTNTSGGIMCIGGPALVYYVTPSEEELFSVSQHPTYTPCQVPETNNTPAIQPRTPKAIAREASREARRFRQLCWQTEGVLQEREA